jgi:hypothetical protein
MNLVVCLPGNSYSNIWVFNYFLQFLDYLQRKGIKFILSPSGGSNVSQVRENIMGYKKDLSVGPLEELPGWDATLWIDSDILWTPDDFNALVEMNVDVASGFYIIEPASAHLVNGKLTPNWDQIGETVPTLQYPEIKDLKQPIETLTGAMGFCLIRKKVYQAMKRPYFSSGAFIFPKGNSRFVGEDVSFFLRVRQAGFKIWSHPKVVVTHYKPTFWNIKTLGF